MTDHFRAIGFRAATEKAFRILAERTLRFGASTDVPDGGYVRWETPCGAAVSAAVDENDDVVAINPCFRGTTEVRAIVRAEHPGDSALEGAFELTLVDHHCPVTVEMTDWALVHDRSLTATATATAATVEPLRLHVAVFAYALATLETAEAGRSDSESCWVGAVRSIEWLTNEDTSYRRRYVRSH
jgi:hypothetical protein